MAKVKKAAKTTTPKKTAAKEKVATENPRGKQGANISQEKYDFIRQHILSHIWRKEEISFAQLLEDLEAKLSPSFDGSVSWYVTTVKMDLETKEIIEQVPGKKTQHLRLKQRLEKPDDV